MEKAIHIFDLDDSLMETPTFADILRVKDGETVDTNAMFSEYFLKIKSAFWDKLSKDVYFKRSGDFIVPCNKATNKPFAADLLEYFDTPEFRRLFLVEDGILVVNAFPGFHRDPETLGWLTNDSIINDYEQADNKMILTGRGEDLRDKIVYILKYLGMGYPNYGLKLFQPTSKTNIEQYKVKEILNSIKENGWDTVHFYEDRLDWLRSAQLAVAQLFPTVKFVAHPITNIKEKRRLSMT